ncbi:MAG: PilZ domain-containing protein [Nitrospirae bacterium]|nr:MAG: PilZ domain-containing protein [Nitrospirota bacterium]
MKLRKYPRVHVPSPFPLSFTRVEVPASFSGDTEGNGVVSNLSMKGCKVDSEATVEPGDHVSLSLALPGEESPLVVELATVRWTEERSFGLEFISMWPAAETRLRQLVHAIGGRSSEATR